MSQQNNQNEDTKVFARHVIVRDTKTGGSSLTLFMGVEELGKLKEDIEQALALVASGDAEGGKVGIVTGEGKNGKPYALIGIGPSYPSAGYTPRQGQAPAQQVAAAKPAAYQPKQYPAKPQTQGYQPKAFGAKKLG